jgi:diketogulonate reductase-like aldo/keto reductase
MPLLGFGTWQIKGAAATEAVGHALAAGYRHLDTATIYGNEKEVGAGLAGSGVARDDVFVTTKCPPRNAGRELDTLRTSLDLLGTDRVDLWLIHWPGGSGTDVAMWQAFAEAQQQGFALAIGVSNFSLDLVDEVTRETGVRPAVNQVEWSPLLFDREVLDGHRARGVVLEGYSALRGGTLDHPTTQPCEARRSTGIRPRTETCDGDRPSSLLPSRSDLHRRRRSTPSVPREPPGDAVNRPGRRGRPCRRR